MTDIKLLPLPLKQALDLHIPSGVRFYGHSNESMQHYARANVAHATAAKDAEIEALVHDLEQTRANVMAEHEARIEAEVRAERLEEALRSLLGGVDDLTSYMAEDDEIGYRPCCSVLSYKEHTDDCAITQARAALRDHFVEST